jgi:type II secretory pathway pseudopilin PulG
MIMKRTQQGMTVIEAMAALAIATMLLLGLSTMIDASLDDVKGQQTALYQEQVTNAANKYITANYTALVSSTAGGTVDTITIAQLKAGGFLSNSFSDTNAFSQTPCVLVRQPAAGKLDALVATRGGQAIPDRDLPLVAMYAGQGGGYISSAAPATARGASWSLVTTNYLNVACGGAGADVLTGAGSDGGHLVSSLFYDGPGQLSTDFLYRDAVPGRPELNKMNTSLTMAAPIIMEGSALVTPGAACGSSASFGMDDATRSLLACGKDGKWQAVSTWKEPVQNYSDLPTTGNTSGDVRMVKALSRAFTYDGSGWVALAVDQNGNMSVPDTLTVYGIRNNWLSSYWVEGQSLYVNQPVTAGTPCNIPNGTGVYLAIGTIRRDQNGYLLVCAWDSIFRYDDGSLTHP